MIGIKGLKMKRNRIIKEYKISKNFVIREVSGFYKDKQQYGYCEKEGKNIVIEIKHKLYNWEKSLALMHELTHIIQFEEQDNYENKLSEDKIIERDEKIANDMEKILAVIVKKIPFFLIGLIELLYDIRYKKEKTDDRQ